MVCFSARLAFVLIDDGPTAMNLVPINGHVMAHLASPPFNLFQPSVQHIVPEECFTHLVIFESQLPDLSTDDLNGRRTAVTSSLSLIKRVNETFHEAVNYGKIGFGRPTALRPGGRVARFPSPIRGHTHVR